MLPTVMGIQYIYNVIYIYIHIIMATIEWISGIVPITRHLFTGVYKGDWTLVIVCFIQEDS